ncbi:hypothetical protein DICVIV_14124 [Dictyocaulus viviparus]|uniref:Uncharacterized protein n=1 Tax=Dictyocaulus viviparus TaxID=29172 RepID=A0A0D8XBX1_DICVI|nr:hypothetical protein DICVIV_14124 [Dictyocaulus viviparus]
MSQLSMLSGEKSAEILKGMKNKKYPTLATGVKSKVEEARRLEKEAQRVAENERRMAECAARRRAKDEANKMKELKQSSLEKSDEMKSEKTTTSDDQNVRKAEHLQQNTERNQSMKDSDKTNSRLNDSEITKSLSEQEGKKLSSNVFDTTKSLPNSAADMKKASNSVVVREERSNDGSQPNALGFKAVKYQINRRAGSAPGSPRDDIVDDKDESSRSQRTSPSSSVYGKTSSTLKMTSC